MFDQTFALADIPRLLTLIFLEGVLSVDNALAIALIVRGLPEALRQKALFIGLSSAVILRAFGVLSAAYLIQLYWVQILGGAYLLYLSLSHVLTRRKEQKQDFRGGGDFGQLSFLLSSQTLLLQSIRS
ncbi:MAG: hypothetical protein KDK71_05070 [Chlamydiia bacterium]|nr:hypothetical protein [Chlamydiia bacterium]